MKRKGFILWKSCWRFCSCQRWRRLFSDSRADGGSHGIYGPAEAGSERSRFCCRFHDREDTEQSQGKRGADERERVQVRSVYMGEGWQG